MDFKKMLNEAIELWGTQDIITIMLSQKIDREMNKEQIKRMK